MLVAPAVPYSLLSLLLLLLALALSLALCGSLLARLLLLWRWRSRTGLGGEVSGARLVVWCLHVIHLSVMHPSS